MSPPDHRTKASFLAVRRAIAQSRIAAIVSGRKGIERRPTQQEIQDSEDRWYEMNHDLEELSEPNKINKYRALKE